MLQKSVIHRKRNHSPDSSRPDWFSESLQTLLSQPNCRRKMQLPCVALERSCDHGHYNNHTVGDHNLHVPCTKFAGSRCRLLKHRRDINAVLLDAGLELREDKRSKNNGDVCIALVRASICGRVFFGSLMDLRKRKALRLVEKLLSEHSCITAVEMHSSARQHLSLLTALQHHRFVRRLTFYGRLKKRDVAYVVEATNSISQVDELAFKAYNFEANLGMNMHMSGYLHLLQMHHLATLDVANLVMHPEEASQVILELTLSRITDLAVGESVYRCGEKGSGTIFARYLAKNDCSLTKLTLQSNNLRGSGSDNLPMTLISALCRMTTLEELNADIIMKDENFMATFALFAEIVARNATLRRLRLPSTDCEYCSLDWIPAAQPPHPDSAKYMEPWLTALRKPNSALVALCVHLRCFAEAECCAFFHALADNDTLNLVTVSSMALVGSVHNVCRTIRESGLSDRVIITDHHVNLADVTDLPHCPEISGVNIEPSHFLFEEDNMERLCSAFEVLSHCKHVTSLDVGCYCFDRTAFSALTTCIRGHPALTDVAINLDYYWTQMTEEEYTDVETELFSALASNPNLVKISVVGAILSADNFNLLSDGFRSSRSLIKFRLTPSCITGAMHDDECSWHLVLRWNEASNSMNTGVAGMQECTTRNDSLVRAAIHFVLGERDDVKGARAIELVHDHPRVLERIWKRAAVTKTEATKMIASALWRVRYCNVHEFMRLAGVVKNNVQCLDKPTVELQLLDINDYCWLRIRSFLKIDDVVEV
ncbi:uncharacterized protein LOC125947124 [Dermacentor silvarum]|uniref:uncharacterized protein LOC125947124 n=1 Tax=Dermacentor silvarum TaxID=543639 RepID=UPI0021011353|nr:uncharacterized protein LOC125947124 [Dermacentor silvarum]